MIETVVKTIGKVECDWHRKNGEPCKQAIEAFNETEAIEEALLSGWVAIQCISTLDEPFVRYYCPRHSNRLPKIGKEQRANLNVLKIVVEGRE